MQLEFKKLIFCIFLSYCIELTLAQRSCQLHYDIESFQSNSHGNSLLYIYIPVEVVQITQNSIEIFNEEGEVLDCLNMKQFRKANDLRWDNPTFIMMKHIVDNLYVIHFVADDNGGSVIRNNAFSLIVDDYFNVKYYFFKLIYQLINYLNVILEKNIQCLV